MHDVEMEVLKDHWEQTASGIMINFDNRCIAIPTSRLIYSIVPPNSS